MNRTDRGENRWKPVRKGAIYCSPACGADCTYAAFQLAQRRAKKLCKDLGAGFTPDVTENLGWHVAARHQLGTVHATYRQKEESYWANFIVDDKQFHATRNTPRGAVAAVVAEMRRVKKFYEKVVLAMGMLS